MHMYIFAPAGSALCVCTLFVSVRVSAAADMHVCVRAFDIGLQSAYNRMHRVNRTVVEQTEPSGSSFVVLLCIHQSMRCSMRMRSVGFSIRTRFSYK